MAIKIITDSTCDLGAQNASKLGIEVVPLKVVFGEEEFRDTIDITKEEFYKKLEKSKKLPTTSQVNPDEFLSIFKKFDHAGDTIIGIFVSSTLSGTYQSAVIAATEVEHSSVFIIDSQTITVGLSILLKEAVKMRDEGRCATEIVKAIENLKSKVRLVAVVNTLKYFLMGGRISASRAIFGEVMGISPLVEVFDGDLSPIGKARGKKAIFAFFDDYISRFPVDENYPIAFAHTCDPNGLAEFVGHIGDFKGNCFTGEIGSVVGTHAGPKAYGMAYIQK